MVGIAVITAALVILLSAFNGIEQMIEKLYSDFDSDITIRSSIGKTFPENLLNLKDISQTEGVVHVSRVAEEVVVLKHEKKRVNAVMMGVDSSFLAMSKMSEHIVDGEAFLNKGDKDFAIIGASLLDKLGGFIPDRVGFEQLIFYVPKRDSKVRLGSNPFSTQLVDVSARMNFNREVNAEQIVVPLDLARDLLNYNSDISAIYADVEDGVAVEDVKEDLQEKLGKDFQVRTSYEKNELIYKTSKSEKLIVLIILLFIFILAAFNLVASLTMLFVEKKDNIETMIAFGADYRSIFGIFFLEGLLISGKGILIGVLLGYGICFLQISTSVLTMPNSGGEPFPVDISFADGILIVFLVSLLSFLFSYLPVRYLLKKNFSQIRF